MGKGGFGKGNAGKPNVAAMQQPPQASSGNQGTGGSGSVSTGVTEGNHDVAHAIKGKFSTGHGNGNLGGGDY